ncbi:MAG: hypothetical protein WC480_04615 [Patescibacteria group bacterium]
MSTCKNCHQDFTITDQDRQFYHKINLPEPVDCPRCRDINRMAWRAERFLYPRTCAGSGKNILSIVAPDSSYQVFSNEYWYSDQWDGLNYGRDYNPEQPFFEQYYKMAVAVPRLYAFAFQNINSEYSNGSQQNKDCYLLFVSDRNEDCYYVYGIFACKDTMDCLNMDKSELCYECIDSFDCYHCLYGWGLRNCRDVYFCYDCSGCSDCFMCSNLRSRQYCWHNEQLSAEEYQKRLAGYDLGSRRVLVGLETEFRRLAQRAIHQYAYLVKCTDCTGDLLKNCKRSLNCYESYDLIDCYNLQVGVDSKWCRDCYVAVDQCELCYDCVSVVNSYNCHFCIATWHNRDCYYCDTCVSCHDCFGCTGLKHKSFCLLNKQYSETEYRQLREKAISQMQKAGEWGQFFPAQYSPFAYNETIACDLYPLTKEEVLKRGWRWQDNLPGTFGKETVKEVADNIKDITEQIIKEVLVCQNCQKNYKIIPQELALYHKQGLPVPDSCFNCRHLKRWQSRNPRKLWTRQCDCRETKHEHQERCSNRFETPYPSTKLEKVYCEECYQKEIY